MQKLEEKVEDWDNISLARRRPKGALSKNPGLSAWSPPYLISLEDPLSVRSHEF